MSLKYCKSAERNPMRGRGKEGLISVTEFCLIGTKMRGKGRNWKMKSRNSTRTRSGETKRREVLRGERKGQEVGFMGGEGDWIMKS